MHILAFEYIKINCKMKTKPNSLTIFCLMQTVKQKLLFTTLAVYHFLIWNVRINLLLQGQSGEVLCAVHVSLSQWQASHGAHQSLQHQWRHCSFPSPKWQRCKNWIFSSIGPHYVLFFSFSEKNVSFNSNIKMGYCITCTL